MTTQDDHERALTTSAEKALAELGAALNDVDISSVAGFSGMPLLQFKSREANGTWMFGQNRTVPEPGSRWAVNPRTFQRGFDCWGEGNKLLDERLVPARLKQAIDPAELPDLGFEWQPVWVVNMKCLDGINANVEVIHKMSTRGGIQAIVALVRETRDRFNGGQHEGQLVPVVTLEKGSYPHSQHGKTWFPVMPIVDWLPLSGPTTAPSSPPPPTADTATAEPSRRRRVG